jgi:hypothetical protein
MMMMMHRGVLKILRLGDLQMVFSIFRRPAKRRHPA